MRMLYILGACLGNLTQSRVKDLTECRMLVGTSIPLGKDAELLDADKNCVFSLLMSGPRGPWRLEGTTMMQIGTRALHFLYYLFFK